MSKFYKSNMTVNGNQVRMSMPFAKVDRAQRLVSGWATLDNIDTQDDVVLAEASANAFARARGNIREMHQPIAVGKMVDFREDEYFHEGEFYRGIFVTAHVSEGAEDTWKKVLDGTLTGFSIGGEINKASSEFVAEAGRTIRFIEDYDLVELSLVDNPANQLANVLSIQKSASGNMTVKMGEVVDTVVENVFICKTDTTVIVKDTESESCPQCGNKMENAGWFEVGADRAEKVQSIVTKFLNPADKEAAPISDEGGVEMGNKGVTKSQGTEEEVGVVNPSETTETGEKIEESDQTSVPVDDDENEETATVDETEGTEDEGEGAVSPEEVIDEETEISKKIDELHDAVKTSLEESRNETLEKVGELEKKVEEATQTFLAKASEIEEKMNGFGEKIEAQKGRLAELESSLEKMNSSEAFKKSADLIDESAEKSVQKDASWNGAFSGRKPSGGFSVDNLM